MGVVGHWSGMLRIILDVYGTGVEDQWEERETGNGEATGMILLKDAQNLN